MRSPYFSPSFHVPASGKYAVIVAALVVLPSAWLYAWSTAPAPSVVNLLLTPGLGLWLALVVTGVAKFGKIRNPQWMGRAGLFLGTLAWYVQWAAWIFISGLASEPLPDFSAPGAVAYLCVRPDLMIGTAIDIVANASGSLSGVARVVVWCVELCVCVLPPWTTGARRAAAPFCEQTGTWAEEVHVPLDFKFIDDPEAVRRRLERDPRELYSVLVPCSDDEQRIASVTIHRCRGSESFVTICNFAELAPEQVPIPEIRNLNAAMPDKVQSFGQIGEPVVELLRFPAENLGAMLRQWEEAASVLEDQADGFSST